MDKKIGIACDHAGFQLKELMVGYLDSLGYDVFDFGCESEESCDYADFAHPLGQAIDNGELKRGIAICGSGNGINMTVNKHQSVRGALCWTDEIAALARAHNNANVCSLPARFIDNTLAIKIVDTFLATEFEGGRHQARIDKIPLK
ncbi:MAG: RpiB/LacA/LacB family sugar-phosphate isomerase [Rikenellaceae bacterium]|jgi:ribose 5-phosphate isomerase B|nr:RpiB/LacA/LacB family sugar-phosphate isomerase [Rikenellaceae bacterium]